jgi:hypothetical protein
MSSVRLINKIKAEAIAFYKLAKILLAVAKYK